MRSLLIPGVAILFLITVCPALLAQPAEPPPAEELFGQAEAQGPSASGNPGGGHPQMVGDLGAGLFVCRQFAFPTTIRLQATRSVTFDPESLPPTTTTTTQTILVRSTILRDVNVALASRGPFKIGENESPAPVDRVYTSYNYFNGTAVLQSRPDSIPGLVTQANAGAFNSSSTVRTGSDTTTTTNRVQASFDPAAPFARLDVHREVFGFEKLLFTDNFSVGVRVPMITQTGAHELESSRLGDLDVILKYALINNRETGNVLSVGFLLTAPTGEDVRTEDGQLIHSTLLQPFLGYFVNLGRFYLQGFSSVIVPTDERDSTLLCNDLGLGFRLYEDRSASRFVRFVTPTLEGHLTSPVNHAGTPNCETSFIGFPDIFVGTAALHIGLGDRGALTLGAGTPMTGPQPFNYEGIVQFNFRF